MERIEDRREYWEVRREQLERKLVEAAQALAAFETVESGQLELNYEG